MACALFSLVTFSHTARALSPPLPLSSLSPLSLSQSHMLHLRPPMVKMFASMGWKGSTLDDGTPISGAQLTYMLLESGQLYFWTDSDSNVRPVDRFGDIFATIFSLELWSRRYTTHKVLAVKCGKEHAVARTREPLWNVYTWGKNSSGQLGHGDLIERKRPTRVLGLQDTVVQVECGNKVTFARLAKGAIYAWGKRGRQIAGPAMPLHLHSDVLKPQLLPLILSHNASNGGTGMTEYHRLKRVGEDMEHRDRTTQNTFRRKITNALERLLEEDIDSVGGTSGGRGMGDADEGDKEDKKPRQVDVLFADSHHDAVIRKRVTVSEKIFFVLRPSYNLTFSSFQI